MLRDRSKKSIISNVIINIIFIAFLVAVMIPIVFMFSASLISFIQILHNSLIVINGLVPHFHSNNNDSTNKIHSDSHLIDHFSFLLEGFFLISFLSLPSSPFFPSPLFSLLSSSSPSLFLFSSSSTSL